MVQGEPTEEDVVVNVDGMNFAVEDFYETVFNKFEIDYSTGLLRKGFVIYPNGNRDTGC